jgi:hypothetical protein
MDETGASKATEDTGSGPNYPCEQCGEVAKSPQGRAGHRRLAHSASTRSRLEAKEGQLAQREAASKRQEAEVARRAADAQRREAEAARRQQEIADTGPAALGMSQCPDCRAWFDTPGERRTHVRSAHPIEDAVAKEVGRDRERVLHEWTEAARKQKENPDKSAEWVVSQFWWPTDKKILRALLAKNATFRSSEE